MIVFSYCDSRGLHMRNFLFVFIFIQSCFVFSQDRNLVILLDREKKENVHSDEFNVTHQMISIASQKQSVMIVQKSLYDNYQARVSLFRSQKRVSVFSDIVHLQADANKALQASGSYKFVNKKLNQSWFHKKYSRLSHLSDEKMRQLQFNFFCYQHAIDFDYWEKVTLNSQLIMFIPKVWISGVAVDVFKKSRSIDSVVHEIMKRLSGNWYVYASGHGALAEGRKPGIIAGLTINEFRKLLKVLQSNRVKLFVYASCYAGGVHSVQPYQNMKFNFPIIIFSITDSQTYVFGNPAGVKLPPYGQDYVLTDKDIKRGKLADVFMIHIDQLKEIVKNNDISLDALRKLNPFYYCHQHQCFIEKVENVPLVRYQQTEYFVPFVQSYMNQMVDVIDGSSEMSVADKLLLVYAKLTHKIEATSKKVSPMISMLPGKHTHRVQKMHAHAIGFQDLMKQLFFGIDDAHLQKSFLIDEVTCQDDVERKDRLATFKNVMVLHEHMFMPEFMPQAQSIVFAELYEHPYVIEFWNNQVHKIAQISKQQHAKIKALYKYLQKSLVYGIHSERDLLYSQQFKMSEIFHKDLIDRCKNQNICF